MSKRIKYIISSLVASTGFFFFASLPFESRYYGLLVGIVLMVFCFWFGLGIVFEENLYTRLMAVVLPVIFFIGFGLFIVLLPLSPLATLGISIFFGLISYMMFLVENVFLVSIGYRTPPLYRAAYTVSFIVLLLTSFFLFDSLFSFRFSYWINILFIFAISSLIFLYHFYSVSIELTDDGKNKNIGAYVLIPSLLMSQLGLAFSFWPVGIFKGSIYLVSVIYVLCSLLQADIRGRLFKRTWLTYTWIGTSIVLAVVLTASWR